MNPNTLNNQFTLFGLCKVFMLIVTLVLTKKGNNCHISEIDFKLSNSVHNYSFTLQ